MLATRRTTALSWPKPGSLPVSAQTMSSSAGFSLAASASLHPLPGGTARDGRDGLLWEINGTEGEHSGLGHLRPQTP